MVNNMEKEWKKVYETNQELDKIFYEKFQDDNSIYEKNCIEILVELGEFVNETKVFKYWSIKKPNKEKMLDEYADNITMCLFFMNELKLEIEEDYHHIETNDKIKLINYLFSKMSMLMDNTSEQLIKDIFGNLLYLGRLFDFKEREIINAINKKHKIIKERLNSDY